MVDATQEAVNGLSVSAILPVTPENNAKVRLDYVDGLRAIAALMVILDHVYFQTFPNSYGRIPQSALAHYTRFFILGHLGVPVFLVISGYCLMLPVIRNGGLLRGGLGTFIKRRAHRILPPYYFALCACFLLNTYVINMHSGGQYDTAGPITAKGAASHVLMLQDLFSTLQFNAAFWSLAVEWKIYFLFPLLLFGWRKIGPWPTLGLATVIGLLLFHKISPHFDRASPHFIALFALGMLAATIVYDQRPQWKTIYARVPWWMLTALSVAALAIACYYKGVMALIYYKTDFLAGAITLFALVAASQNGQLGRALSWRPLVFLGTFSYSIYMMHGPFMQVVCQRILYPWSHQLSQDTVGLLTLFAVVPLVLGLSYLFFLGCESPFLNRRTLNG